MANVLPQEIQKRIVTVQRARYIIAGSVVLTAAAVISLIALLPNYILVTSSRGDSASNNLSQAEIAKDTTYLSDLTATQATLGEIAPLVSSSTSPSAAIIAALILRPKGISIDQLTYAPGSLIVSGSAVQGSAIDAYRSALAGDPHFTSAVVPVGVLLGNENGRFSITLSGTF